MDPNSSYGVLYTSRPNRLPSCKWVALIVQVVVNNSREEKEALCRRTHTTKGSGMLIGGPSTGKYVLTLAPGCVIPLSLHYSTDIFRGG